MRIFLFLFALCFSPLANSQTCSAPGGPLFASLQISDDSCGGSNEFSQICGGGLTTVGASRTYRLDIGLGNLFDLTVNPTNSIYDPALFAVGPNLCGATAPCAPNGDADDNGPGEPESIFLSSLASGTYYVVVSSTNLSSPGSSCGPYTLFTAGFLPVELKSFSIE